MYSGEGYLKVNGLTVAQNSFCIALGNINDLTDEFNRLSNLQYKLVETSFYNGMMLNTNGSALNIGSVWIFSIP